MDRAGELVCLQHTNFIGIHDEKHQSISLEDIPLVTNNNYNSLINYPIPSLEAFLAGRYHVLTRPRSSYRENLSQHPMPKPCWACSLKHHSSTISLSHRTSQSTTYPSTALRSDRSSTRSASLDISLVPMPDEYSNGTCSRPRLASHIRSWYSCNSCSKPNGCFPTRAQPNCGRLSRPRRVWRSGGGESGC